MSSSDCPLARRSLISASFWMIWSSRVTVSVVVTISASFPFSPAVAEGDDSCEDREELEGCGDGALEIE